MDAGERSRRRRVGREVSRFWYTVYQLQQDARERIEMLLEDAKLNFQQFTIAVALERWYVPCAQAMLAQGIPLSKGGFCMAIGMPMMTPVAAAELLANGLQVNGFQLIAAPRPAIFTGGQNGGR